MKTSPLLFLGDPQPCPFRKALDLNPRGSSLNTMSAPKTGVSLVLLCRFFTLLFLPISLSFFPNSDYNQQFLLKCFWSNYIRFLYPNKTLTDQILGNQSGTEKIIVYLEQLGFLYINKTYQIFDN